MSGKEGIYFYGAALGSEATGNHSWYSFLRGDILPPHFDFRKIYKITLAKLALTTSAADNFLLKTASDFFSKYYY